MKQTALRKNRGSKGSTQSFTEIQDIKEDVVLFKGGSACLIIEVQATNFSLLSQQEQDTKIFAYASFLNSLSFAVQILIRSKKIDISSYITLLNQQAEQSSPLHPAMSEAQNKVLNEQIKLYRDFVGELVKVNTVLDKLFYIAIPFSYLERGVGGAAQIAKGGNEIENFFQSAKPVLHSKADSVLSQLARLGLRAKTLQKEELITLFYNIYNEEEAASNEIGLGITSPIVKAV